MMNGAVNLEAIQPRFDASSSKLVWGSVDGRLRLFDVTSSQIVSEITKDLANGTIMDADVSQSVYSCLEWGQKGVITKVLLAGAVDGSVLAYDTARMKLLWRKSLPYGAVSSMVSVDKNVLVMTGSGRAIVLDVKSGNELAQWTSPSKFQVSQMESLGDGRVLLGGGAILLVDSTTGARLGKWTGHVTPVISLSCSEHYFCSAAMGDRTVVVWCTRKKAAVARATLNQPIARVSMVKIHSSAAAEEYQLVAVTMSGDIHVFKYSSSTGQIVEWAASEGGSGLPAVQVAINSAQEDGVELTVAFGTVVKPRFSKLRLTASPDGSIVEVAKPDRNDTLGDESLVKSMSKIGKQQGAASHIPLAVAETNEHAVLHGSRRDGQSWGDGFDMEMEDSSDSGSADEDLEVDNDLEKSLTFAERIAALKDSTVQNIHEPSRPSDGEPERFQPKADSLAILLSQALANEDNALLERCLSVKSGKTVSKTARQLSPGDATMLIKMLVQKLQSSPRRAAELTAWIKAVLVHHAGYFAGTGACKESFSNLHQIIDARLSSYSSLLSLNGRLDLVLACANQSRQEPNGVVGGFGRPLVSATIDQDGGIEVHDAAAAIGMDEYSTDEDQAGSDTEEDVSDFSD